MDLSTITLILGAAAVAGGVVGVVKTERLIVFLKGFPRSVSVGVALTLIATAWFVYNLSQESIADFAAFKDKLLLGFAALGIMTCIYVKDYLGSRGLALVMLLLANEMVNAARWEETPWRLVITTWAYVMAVGGMWFTISPWRVRDLIEWVTVSPQKVKQLSMVRIGLGVGLLALGALVY